jgi:GNAT superfamily N-acetyltransferase
MNAELKKEIYQAGDEEKIVELFEKVFGRPMDPAGDSLQHWRWEFLDRPEKDVAIRLAWDQERLAGQYAAGPVRLFVDGKEYSSALSYDTMTDPEYQGQGIFTSLAEQLFADLSAKGYHSIFGFPNGNSIHGFVKKLGWRGIGAPPVFVRPVSPFHLLTEKLKIPVKLAGWISKAFLLPVVAVERIFFKKAKRQIAVREEKRFDDWADVLWETCSQQHRVWVARTKAYLNWRYVAKPFNSYRIYSAWSAGKIAGYAVTCREKKFVGVSTFVMDLLVDAACPDAADALLSQVTADAAVKGALLVCALVTPSSFCRKGYVKHGFFKLPEKLFPQELHFAGRLLPDSVGNEFFYDLQSWGISWGDDDVV